MLKISSKWFKIRCSFLFVYSFVLLSFAIALLRKLKKILARPTLITINKSFIKPHLDYGDIIYD